MSKWSGLELIAMLCILSIIMLAIGQLSEVGWSAFEIWATRFVVWTVVGPTILHLKDGARRGWRNALLIILGGPVLFVGMVLFAGRSAEDY